MNTLGIEAFLAIIRSRSLSKAAESLNIAQTTVSQRLKVLEQELGKALIERGKGVREIRLTPSGEELLKIAEQWNLLSQATKRLQTQGPHLSLSVGSVDSVNTFILPQVYRAISQETPPVKLEIRTSHSIELYAEVENRQVDIAFVVRQLSHPNVYLKKYFSNPMVVLRATHSHNKEIKTIHPSDLDAEHELFMPWGQDNFRTWHDYWWPPFITPQIKLDSARILLSLLQNPVQWAIVPRCIAEEALKQENYAIFQLTDPPPDYTCYRLSHVNPTSRTLKAIEIFDKCFHFVNSSLLSGQDKPTKAPSN